MRDVKQDQATRLDAARAAAPYVHARLAAVEHSGNVGRPSHEDCLAEIAERAGLNRPLGLPIDNL